MTSDIQYQHQRLVASFLDIITHTVLLSSRCITNIYWSTEMRHKNLHKPIAQEFWCTHLMLSRCSVTAGSFEMAQRHRAMCLMVYCHNDKGERKSGPADHHIYLYQIQFFSISILGAKTVSPTTTTTTKQTPSTSISSIQVNCWHLTPLELYDFLGVGPDPFGEVCRDTKVDTIKSMEH